MPKPLPGVDWEFVKALFLQGFTHAQIATKTGLLPGTIKSRAYREGWSLIRSRTDSALASLSQPALAQTQALAFAKQSNALAKASQIAQETFAEELSDQAAVLRSRKPTKLRDLANTPDREGRASVVQKLVSTAAKLYGWDAQSQTPQTLNLTQVNLGPETPTKLIDVPADPPSL